MGTDTGPIPTASSRDLSVFPLASCCDIASTPSVTLGCMVSGYLPMPVTVTWDTGSLNKSVATLPTTFHQTSGLHSAIGQVTTWGEWAKQTFTCSVAHAGSPAINKTFRGEPGLGCPHDPGGRRDRLNGSGAWAPTLPCLVVPGPHGA